MFDDMFVQSPMVMLVVDPVDGTIVDANDTAAGFYGYSREELQSMRMSDINRLPPEEIQAEMDRARLERRKQFLFPHRLRDGTVKTVEVYSGPFIHEGRTLLHSTILDTADRSEAEREAAQDAVRRRVLFDRAADGMCVLDADQRLIDFNHVFADMLGYSHDELTGLFPWDWDASDASEEEISRRWILTDSEGAFMEGVWRQKTGSVLDVEIHTSPFEWEGASGLLAICRDVTTAKAEHLHALRWRKAFESADIGVTNVDVRTNTFVDVNHGFARSHGYEPTELLGRSIFEVYPAEAHHDARELARRAAEWGHASMESIHVRKDGSTFPVWVDATAVRGSDDDIGSRVTFTVDITKRKQAEQQLAALNESLESQVEARTYELEAMVGKLYGLNEELRAADEANSRFLSTVSHEFRTPLNAVIGFSRLMLDGLTGELSDHQASQLEMINESGHQLLTLVNNVLEFSRLETGRPNVTIQRVDLPMLAREVLEAVATSAQAKGLDIKLIVSSGADGFEVESDPARIRQILRSLLDNAVKFTNEGRVSLEVFANGGGAIGLAVRDTGPGIAAEYQESVFEVFSPNRPLTDKGTPGTGMGLAIAKVLAQGIGGRLSLHSKEGEGSTFTLRLPVEWTPLDR